MHNTCDSSGVVGFAGWCVFYKRLTPLGLYDILFTFHNYFTPSGFKYNSIHLFYNHVTPSGFYMESYYHIRILMYGNPEGMT